MAINLIIRFVLAIAVSYIAYMIFSPILYQLRYENAMFDNVDTALLAAADNVYGTWHLMAIVIIGVLVLWAFTNASRKRAEEAV